MKLQTIEIGRIVNAHGIRGEVRIVPLAGQTPDFLTRMERFTLNGQPVSPTANHVHKNFALMKFPGVDDMDAALALKGRTLSITREQAGLAPGEYFDEELPGVEVYEEESGAHLGTITQVERYPASRVITVKGEREYLIPAVPGVFMKRLDLDANRMEVRLLEGMATDEN